MEQNCEVVVNASSLCALWGKMEYQYPACATRGGKKASGFFNKTVGKWLRIKHGVAVKGSSRYIPAIICEGAMRDIYVCGVNDGACEYYGEVNIEALGEYAAIEARLGKQYCRPGF